MNSYGSQMAAGIAGMVQCDQCGVSFYGREIPKDHAQTVGHRKAVEENEMAARRWEAVYIVPTGAIGTQLAMLWNFATSLGVAVKSAVECRDKERRRYYCKPWVQDVMRHSFLLNDRSVAVTTRRLVKVERMPELQTAYMTARDSGAERDACAKMLIKAADHALAIKEVE